MKEIEQYQDKILKFTEKLFSERSVSLTARTAFLRVPRHQFVKKYIRDGEKIEITSENLEENLATIYHNDTIELYSDEENGTYSTMSKPTFVLRMLDLLDLKPGHKVLELGAGSGWNAALMGDIVGGDGKGL